MQKIKLITYRCECGHQFTGPQVLTESVTTCPGCSDNVLLEVSNPLVEAYSLDDSIKKAKDLSELIAYITTNIEKDLKSRGFATKGGSGSGMVPSYRVVGIKGDTKVRVALEGMQFVRSNQSIEGKTTAEVLNILKKNRIGTTFDAYVVGNPSIIQSLPYVERVIPIEDKDLKRKLTRAEKKLLYPASK